MADKKKEAKQASKDVKKGIPATELRDLDMLDSKLDKVKGGRKRNIGRKRT